MSARITHDAFAHPGDADALPSATADAAFIARRTSAGGSPADAPVSRRATIEEKRS